MIPLFSRHRSACGLAVSLLTLFATDGELAQVHASVEQLNSVIAKGDAAYTANKMDEAVSAYAQARELATAEKADDQIVQLLDERYGRSLAQRAQDYLLEGKDAKAQEFIKQALIVLPDDSHVNAVAQRIATKAPQSEQSFYVPTGDVGRVAPSSAITAESGVSDIQLRQQARLENAQKEAMDWLMKGRDAYRMQKYEEALNNYQQALKTMPAVPATAERRDFIKTSIGDASIALAQEYIKVGRYDESRRLLNDALQLNPCNKLAQQTLQFLDDPARTNPALTPQHAKNVTEVNRLLHLAFGHFDLGQYDDALKAFQSVLRIDPYNTSARRGMEMVNKRQSSYYDSARDQARGEALAEVDQMWENAVPAPELPSDPGEAMPANDAGVRTIEYKLSSIVLPRINLSNVDISEAVDFLRNQSIQQDNVAAIDAERGVNITLDLGSPDSQATKAIMAKRFDLKMNNVPLKYALEYITQATGTSFRTNAYTVSVVSASDDGGYMASKVVAVPPGFFSGTGSDSGDDSNPFDDDSSSGSGITLKRIDARKALQQMGMSFPEGSSVRYNPGNSTLFVQNTQKNLQLLDDIVAAKTAQEPLQVVVKATMIEVNEKDLKELGFDWILNTTFLPGKLFGAGGQDQSNTQYYNESIFDNAATVANTAVPTASMTAGLRSMNQVIKTDTIDSLIEDGSKASRGETYDFGRSPSILTVRGVWNDVDLTFVMHGLDQKKDTDILQQPQIIVKPGETAMFYSGNEILYPTSYETPQIPTSSSNNSSNSNSTTSNMQVVPANPTDFEARKTGTLFNVQVNSISEDKTIVDLTVTPEMVEFDGFVNYGTPISMPIIGYNTSATKEEDYAYITTLELTKNSILQPIFTKRGVTTSVSVASGNTLVLGGLKKAKNVKYEDKVPVLGDIPLLGRLFRSEGTQVERKVVLIMIRAEVVDPGGKPIVAAPSMSSEQAL